ncbi:MAG: hypothetical protein ACOYOS_24935 [Syntrophales bacterium]
MKWVGKIRTVWGPVRNALTSTILIFWGRTGDISAMEGDFNLEEMSNRL